MKNAVDILGVQVDPVTAPEAVARIRELIQRGERAYVVTVNPEIIMRARTDAAFRRTLNRADLRVADATGVIWAAHYLARRRRGTAWAYLAAFWWLCVLAVRPARLKRRLPATIPGSDLLRDLAGMCEEFGYRLFLLGAAPGVAERAAAVLREEFPEVAISGAASGSPRASEDADTRARIQAGGTQVLLVAYGAPKQERWIERNLRKLPKPLVAVGVGGSFDYLAGAASLEGGGPARQPPQVVRRRGFEWLWRLVTQPSRWRRILIAFPRFVRAVIRESQA